MIHIAETFSPRESASTDQPAAPTAAMPVHTAMRTGLDLGGKTSAFHVPTGCHVVVDLISFCGDLPEF
ncbi:hypothetical protein CP975_03160 [Streptomyces alboniger]|uniref:Uncharacterized protein n=1 Tax=Streptomyces alboniger TaxID=132473 RepID=A0A5J6HHS6_STRAD|nr:hypothetical protein CP975_03160 [Streptomyces alboniger]